MTSASHHLLFRVGVQQNCENTHRETPDKKSHRETPDTKPYRQTPDTKPYRETPDTNPYREKSNKITILIYREKSGLTSDTVRG
jgi:hypothetical protein